MKRMTSHCHVPQDVFNCHSSIQCSRVNQHAAPVRDYWIPLSEPHALPVHYRAVFTEPQPSHGQAWCINPATHCMLPVPQPPLYNTCVYGPTLSPYPRYIMTPRDIIVGKNPAQTTLTTYSFKNGFLSTLHKQNESNSQSPQLSVQKIKRVETSIMSGNKNPKQFKKKTVDKMQLQIKDSAFKYNKSNHELHPEILATWRKKLNKSKDTLSTHKVKIEICLKKESCKKLGSKEDGKQVLEKYSLENIQNKKMSLSNSAHDEKSSVKNGSISSPVSYSKDKSHSTHDNKKSALMFTPPKLYKVHKRKKESIYKSTIKTNNQKPVIPGLEIKRSRDSGVHPEDHCDEEVERDRMSQSERSSAQKSHSLSYKLDYDLDRSLEPYSSREKYYQSTSSESRFSDSSSPLKSLSPSQKPFENADSEFNMNQSSSIYVTAEGTPFFMKSASEERRSSRVKRSLSEEHNDNGCSSNSSFDQSIVDTRQGSPSHFNSPKRPKIRWSDPSFFRQDKSSYTSWRHNQSCNSEQGVEPELIGYQMVGDSQFCRFGQQLLGLERVPMSNCSGRIGICVSGQTITDLHRRVRDNFYPISDKIILMIGTNDFLRNVNVSTMCEELSALIKTLQKSVSNIVLLTLPPIPKLEKKSMSHFKLLDIYNTHIRSLENGKTLRIADVSPLYMTSAPFQRCKMHLFEVYFGGPAKRFDLIHLNRLGLEIIRKYILDKFLL